MVARVGLSMEKLGSVGTYPKSSEPGHQQVLGKKTNSIDGVISAVKGMF